MYCRLWGFELVLEVIFDPLFTLLRLVRKHQVSLIVLSPKGRLSTSSD